MKDFVGNQVAINYLENAVRNNNLSHAYLFCGPGNVGKTRAGIHLAKLLLCSSEDPFVCKGCPSCKLFESGNHPDFYHFDNDTVSVDEVRSLISSLDLKPYLGKAKVALISHTENLTNQALNSFLKTLEEPTKDTTIILTTENPKNLLPTIVSRARSVNFTFAKDKEVYELINGELGVLKEEAARLCKLAAGRPGFAAKLAKDEEGTNNINTSIADFKRIYKSSDIFEKITYADKLSKDKDGLNARFSSLEVAARSELMSMTIDKSNKERVSSLIKMIDGITRSREMIAANANAKLVIEGLLLGSIV